VFGLQIALYLAYTAAVHPWAAVYASPWTRASAAPSSRWSRLRSQKAQCQFPGTASWRKLEEKFRDGIKNCQHVERKIRKRKRECNRIVRCLYRSINHTDSTFPPPPKKLFLIWYKTHNLKSQLGICVEGMRQMVKFCLSTPWRHMWEVAV
jgi:hypothetical protein